MATTLSIYPQPALEDSLLSELLSAVPDSKFYDMGSVMVPYTDAPVPFIINTVHYDKLLSVTVNGREQFRGSPSAQQRVQFNPMRVRFQLESINDLPTLDSHPDLEAGDIALVQHEAISGTGQVVFTTGSALVKGYQPSVTSPAVTKFSQELQKGSYIRPAGTIQWYKLARVGGKAANRGQALFTHYLKKVTSTAPIFDASMTGWRIRPVGSVMWYTIVSVTGPTEIWLDRLFTGTTISAEWEYMESADVLELATPFTGFNSRTTFEIKDVRNLIYIWNGLTWAWSEQFQAGVRVVESPTDVLGFHIELEVPLNLARGKNVIEVNVLGSSERAAIEVRAHSWVSVEKMYARALYRNVFLPLETEQASLTSPWSPRFIEHLLKYRAVLPDLKSPHVHAVKLAVKGSMISPAREQGVRDFAAALTYNNPFIRAVSNKDFLKSSQRVYSIQDELYGYRFHMWFPSLPLAKWMAFAALSRNVPSVMQLVDYTQEEIDVYTEGMVKRLEQHRSTITPSFRGILDSMPRIDTTVHVSRKVTYTPTINVWTLGLNTAVQNCMGVLPLSGQNHLRGSRKLGSFDGIDPWLAQQKFYDRIEVQPIEQEYNGIGTISGSQYYTRIVGLGTKFTKDVYDSNGKLVSLALQPGWFVRPKAPSGVDWLQIQYVNSDTEITLKSMAHIRTFRGSEWTYRIGSPSMFITKVRPNTSDQRWFQHPLTSTRFGGSDQEQTRTLNTMSGVSNTAAEPGIILSLVAVMDDDPALPPDSARIRITAAGTSAITYYNFDLGDGQRITQQERVLVYTYKKLNKDMQYTIRVRGLSSYHVPGQSLTTFVTIPAE